MSRFSNPVRCSSTAAFCPDRPITRRSARASADDVVPGDGGPAGVRDEQRGQDPHGGGLAGAVGAEQAQHGARRDLEVQAVQGHHVAVLLDQAFGLDRVRHHAAPREVTHGHSILAAGYDKPRAGFSSLGRSIRNTMYRVHQTRYIASCPCQGAVRRSAEHERVARGPQPVQHARRSAPRRGSPAAAAPRPRPPAAAGRSARARPRARSRRPRPPRPAAAPARPGGRRSWPAATGTGRRRPGRAAAPGRAATGRCCRPRSRRRPAARRLPGRPAAPRPRRHRRARPPAWPAPGTAAGPATATPRRP